LLWIALASPERIDKLKTRKPFIMLLTLLISGGKMKKLLVYPIECALVLVLALILATPRDMFAQSHVVPPTEIQKDLATASTARQQNQEQVNRFLSSEEAQRAMKSAHIDSQKVTTAVGQLSDSELAMLAVRSAKAQKDFAAGTLDNRDLLIIIVAIAALILIIVAVR
jgi:hypothetical protein